MRVIVYALLALLVLIQYPLWLGKGGWLHAYDLDKKVQAQGAKNEQLELRNAKLAGEVEDLKDGTRAIEERARIEHGMVKDNEILVQILNDKEAQAKPVPQAKPLDKSPVTSPEQASPGVTPKKASDKITQ